MTDIKYQCSECNNDHNPCTLDGEPHQPAAACPWYTDYIAKWNRAPIVSKQPVLTEGKKGGFCKMLSDDGSFCPLTGYDVQ